ncbi:MULTISPECIES: HD-GYP domain-containing protein [Pseudoalteromonas]|jgi:HD-GYP domain-containing protein (c-di-GMP phosphodiesterase class II)|uniref:HD-GYP domain-containing protein n=1 Tax=Pseudoalteromonas TaxID=53246 RepID=UPI001195F204|nr:MULTISPECIES: HD family phosphohydrolase [Pseudoalteromonas]MBA6409561.1 HD domain-containing protein [Pseudoalteromonas sp. 5Ae-yellow]MDN3389501.1 HD domain-containing phosphohydrolase [Pseudoalteromonas sp. APC 3691]TVU70849.1 HD domain-containing protein [Pseudoalteromonas elyakovii]|tara:strand:+ start:5549 stop:7210 length:1662 start_codon:yes stop_codon:yes gene_type:complete
MVPLNILKSSKHMRQHIKDKTNLQHFIDISIRLTTEKNSSKLLDEILQVVMSIANSDAGSIYSITSNKQLKFETVINKSLNLYLGGTLGGPVDFPNIELFIDGKPNDTAIVAHSVNTGEVINIPDVYDALPFDMSAARKMDARTGYRSESMLTIPLKDHEDDIIGVIQLINVKDAQNKNIPFSEELVTLIRSFASLGAISLTNSTLVKDMEVLFSTFAEAIAMAIDEKSPHTGGHCKRVPALTLMLADAVHKIDKGPLADFIMSPEDRHELSVAGWLHDCGKIATPDHIMEKSTKLETIFDRIEFIDAKFEIISRDLELSYQQQIISAIKQNKSVEVLQFERLLETELKQLALDRALLQRVNIGGEFLGEEEQAHILRISKQYSLKINGEETPLLTDDEVENLMIRRGTLTQGEREIMKRHMDITKNILDILPFPKHLSNVAEYALGHHEKLDGTGYPRGLTKEQMSVPARLMAITDIFEALSAVDRPYKKAKPVSECLNILGNMVSNNHLDPDIFAIFIESEVYKNYINEYANPEQLDEVDFDNLPGYTPIS